MNLLIKFLATQWEKAPLIVQNFLSFIPIFLWVIVIPVGIRTNDVIVWFVLSIIGIISTCIYLVAQRSHVLMIHHAIDDLKLVLTNFVDTAELSNGLLETIMEDPTLHRRFFHRFAEKSKINLGGEMIAKAFARTDDELLKERFDHEIARNIQLMNESLRRLKDEG